jgi:hypothetical protein
MSRKQENIPDHRGRFGGVKQVKKTTIRLTNYVVVAIIVGIIYVFMEVFFTSVFTSEMMDKYSFRPVPSAKFEKMAFKPWDKADEPAPIQRMSLIGASSIWMFLLGALCGLCLFLIHKKGRERLNLFWQTLLGAAVITILELIAGLLLNGLGRYYIWDYTKEFMNLWGQICLKHTLMYLFPLVPVAYWFFHFLEAQYDELPEKTYSLFKHLRYTYNPLEVRFRKIPGIFNEK